MYRLNDLVVRMSNIFKGRSRNSIIYLASNTIGYGLAFSQNLFFASYFEQKRFGLYTLYYAAFSFFIPIMALGLEASILRLKFEEEHFSNQRELITNITSIWLVNGLFLSVIVIVLFFFFGEIFNYFSLTSVVFLCYSVFIYSFLAIYQSWCIANENASEYGKILIVSKFLVFSCFFLSEIVFSSLNYSFQILAFESLFLFFLLRKFFANINFRLIDLEKMKFIWRYSFPLGINSFASLGFGNGLKIIISPLISLEALGMFNLATQFGNVGHLIISSISKSYIPQVYKIFGYSEIKESSIFFYKRILLRLMSTTYSFLILGAFVFLSFFKDGIYFSSFFVFVLLIINYSFLILKSIPYLILSYQNKTYIIAKVVILSSVLTIFLAFLFTSLLNIYGLSLAISIGMFLQYRFLKKSC